MTTRRRASVVARGPALPEGSTHISVVRHLPEVLRSLGADPAAALEAAGVRADVFDDPRNTIEYTRLERLLTACVELTNCDYVALLIGRHTRLSDFGLAGRSARCAATAGEGLQSFIDHFNLHSTATTVSLASAGHFSRFIYAISVGGITEAAQFQLGAVAVSFNVLQDLFGRQWLPTAVTFATHAPSRLRPFHEFFRAPLRFDCDESAVVFDRHWLDRPLPVVDPSFRREVQAELLARQAAMLEDVPAMLRRLLRRQLPVRSSRMDAIARTLGMHRRTLDRHLQRQGVQFGRLREGVTRDVAQQLLRDTGLQVQHIAESLGYSNAANFATAFRRWTGMTPSEYRRRGR